MKKCDGCGTEFDDSVSLFPRLVISKEVQVARRLAEREEEEDMLCLGCWLEAVDHLDKKQLAMLLLGMLRKIDGLQEELAKRFTFPQSPGIIEKDESPWAPQPHPYTIPNTSPIWIKPPDRDTVWVGDPPGRDPYRAVSSPCLLYTSPSPRD